MPRDESLSEQRIKHLEFIQSIVTRLSGNSFLIKGWAITVTAAIFAFGARDGNWQVATVALLPIAAFCLLDTYYLRQERLFRCLYNDVRRLDVTTEPFSMNVDSYKEDAPFLRVLSSLTILGFYGPILLIAIALLIANAAPALLANEAATITRLRP